MAKPHPFSTHHAAAGKAFASGNHSGAMHHIGHMMLAVRAAAKGTPAPTTATDGPTPSQAMSAAQAGSDDDQGESMSGTGVATPEKQHFFGQFGPKGTPKAAPHKPAPQSPLTATNHSAKGGFNRARFGKN